MDINGFAQASLYASINDMRVGPSCPVCFNQREQVSKWWNRRGAYQAFVVRQDANGRRYMALVTRPSPNDGEPVVMQRGQYSNSYPHLLG